MVARGPTQRKRATGARRKRRLPSLVDGDRPPRDLADRAGRDPDTARPRADGGRQRAGVPPPGTALRRGSRVLRDGQLRRHRAPQRADARVPPRRRGRAPARHPAVRLRARHDGRGGADGRGGRRRPRRPQLRLPRQEGDEDGRRGDAARRSRSRVRASSPPIAGAVDAPGDGEDAPRAARRLARLPRRRAAPRRGRSGVAHAASALGAADVHGLRRPRAHRRARLARRRARRRLGRHRVARAARRRCSRRPARRP